MKVTSLPSRIRYPLWLAVIAVCIFSAPGRADIETRVSQATSGLRDVSIRCKVTYANRNELKKIGRDLASTYEFKQTLVQYKAPDKFKIEGKLGMIKVRLLINGDEKGIYVPLRGWHKENIRDAPHKRQTDFDMGIVSRSLWRCFVVQGEDTVTDLGAPAYKITFAWSNSRDKKQICWVDTQTLKMLKRQAFESDGSLIATYIYSDHHCLDGIWVPGRVDVYGCDGKLAGTTVLEDIKVNSGIPDSEFRF